MIHIGLLIYGHCDGKFGRDHYGKYRIEAIGGDWLVARNAQQIYTDHPDIAFCTFRGPNELREAVKRWSSEDARLAWEES